MTYKILSIFIITVLVFVLPEKHKDYGSFKVEITSIDHCKGPKRKDCSVFHMKINNSVAIDFDVLLTETMSPNKGKVLVISNGNEFVRVQIKNPCNNLFMKPFLSSLFNATNCVIKKGHYIFTLDFQNVLRNYYGGMHLYGLYAFKTMLYGDTCNFSCVSIEVRLSKNLN